MSKTVQLLIFLFGIALLLCGSYMIVRDIAAPLGAASLLSGFCLTLAALLQRLRPDRDSLPGLRAIGARLLRRKRSKRPKKRRGPLGWVFDRAETMWDYEPGRLILIVLFCLAMSVQYLWYFLLSDDCADLRLSVRRSFEI